MRRSRASCAATRQASFARRAHGRAVSPLTAADANGVASLPRFAPIPTSRARQYRSLLFVFTLIFILVSHREGTKIKVKNRVKIKWNTTRILIYERAGTNHLHPKTP